MLIIWNWIVRAPWYPALQVQAVSLTILEAETITNTILEVPYYDYSTMGPKTLF